MICADCGYEFRKGDQHSVRGADEVVCRNPANCRRRQRSGKHALNLATTETDVEVMLTAIADRLREECVRAVIEPALESEERLRYLYGKAISGQTLIKAAYW